VSDQWFPLTDEGDDSFDVGVTSPAEELFIATLRRYHAGWADLDEWAFTTFVVRTDDDYPGPRGHEPIIAVIDMRSDVYAASFDGTRLRCNYAHPCMWYLYRPPTPEESAFFSWWPTIYLEAEGDPEQMGAVAADWFLTQIRRHGHAAR
jgi:hypothetical protein